MVNRNTKTIPLEYNLPSTVDSVQQGWTRTCQASMVISGSLTLMATILLIFFKNNQGGEITLEIFGYAALFLNMSACMSGFILIDRLGDMPWNASQEEQLSSVAKMVTTQQNLLRKFGAGALWPWIMGHWLICFVLGFLAITAEILTYVWINKSSEVKIVTIILAAFCLLPFFAFILAPIVNRLIDSIVSSETSSIAASSTFVSMVDIPQTPVSNRNRQRTMTGQSFRTGNTPVTIHRISFPNIAESSKA